MAPEDGQRLATRVDRARAETEAQRARIAEMYRRERADARGKARSSARSDQTPSDHRDVRRDDVAEPDEDTAGDYEPDDRDRLASAAESAARAAAAAADIETFAREMESKHRIAFVGAGGIGGAAPGEGDADGMSLGFGPWDDAFRYDVAFAYRPNVQAESAPGDGDGDGDGTRREGSGGGRAVGSLRGRPSAREGAAAVGEGGGADDEEEGEASGRVDSPPSADSDVERVDEDAAATTPAEDEKEDEDVGQSQSQQKSTKGPSRAAALLRAASAKEMKTKPKRAGFFARMFGGGGKKEGAKAEGARRSRPARRRPTGASPSRRGE